jgi:hypothetical protein
MQCIADGTSFSGTPQLGEAKVNHGIRIAGIARFVTLDAGRTVFDTGWKCNLVVASGPAAIAAILAGEQSLQDVRMAIGTGNTPPSAGDIALIAEVASDYHPSFQRDNASWQVMASFINSWSGTYSEAGLFIGSNMVSRILTTGSKTASQILVGMWEITFS